MYWGKHMSYTNPGGQPQGYPYYFTNKLREALISEIIAINGYEEHIANSNMPGVNAIWTNIIGDEKQHYGQFLILLHKYDPFEYQEYIAHSHDTFQITPMQVYEPVYNQQIILNNIREDIKGEFEAVILYEQIAIEMPYQDIRDTFHSIATTEKEHAEHLTKLLITLDPVKYNGLT
jgi:rubrerythrin